MAVTADCAARACACACTASCCAYAASCCACSACAFAAASAASASSRAVLSATSASRRAVSSSALYLMSDAIRVAIRVAIRCHSRHQPQSAHYLRESVSRSSRSAMRDAVPDEGGHQHTLRRTQTHSDALRAIREHSDAIRRNQRQYPTLQLLARGAIRRNQTQSDAISGSTRLSNCSLEGLLCRRLAFRDLVREVRSPLELELRPQQRRPLAPLELRLLPLLR